MNKELASYARRFKNASSFQDHIKLALEFHARPDILQLYSPLAKPYFLYQSDIVSDRPDSFGVDAGWGDILVEALRQALQTLWGGSFPDSHDELVNVVDEELEVGRGSKYAFFILELNYFKAIYRPHPRSQATIYNDILYISRATHDRHLKEAVEQISQILLTRLRPAVRLEMPRPLPFLIGRRKLLELGKAHLEKNGSISLIGPGGVGKTSLATALGQQLTARDFFFYTIQPGFNDSLRSFLFALAAFLHRKGGSALWQQIIADGGTLSDPNMGLGLLLADFQAISRPLLISIDEIDLLDHSQDGGENERHQQLLHFLRQLRGKVALLLVGHRAVIESDVTQTVEPLGADDLMSWFETLSIPAQQGTIARLITLTQGNPLLISMAFALYFWSVEQDPTVTFDDALKQMPQSGALLPIWRRLASRLDGNELALLEALSVFRGAAPADAWMVESNEGELVSLVGRLESRQLIQNDGQGGVYLLPSLRQLINEEQGVEQREQRHLQAALIFSQRGEPTEAAFHFLAGGRADKAIEIWYPHRASEIERGQVEKANAIFESLSARNLKPAWQKRLAIVRSELNQLSGQHDRVIRDLSRQRWQNNQFESIEAYKLWGDALQDQGQPDAAEEILSQGLDVVTHLLQRYSYLHVQRSRLYLQQREMANAKREADLARFHAENMHGAIQDQLGNYDLAILHYETALSLAESLKDFRNVARTQYYMAIAMSRLQRFEESVSCFEKAIEAYKRVGDRVQAEHVRSNLGASYLFAEEYEEAIKYCLDALAFYERSGNTYWVAHNACNLAEAYYALGKYKDAEGYAQLAISQEEIDSLPYALYTLGMVRKVANDLTSAARFLLETGQYAENNEDRFLLAYSLRELGSAYRQLGKVDEGNACIGRSLALFKQLKIEKEVVSTELLLHESQ